MKTSEILDAMHLLLATDTFSPANLQELATHHDYDINTPLINRLKSMYDSYVASGNLLSNDMLGHFPGRQVVRDGSIGETYDMIQFARALTKWGAAEYCVFDMAESLGQMLSYAYKFEDCDEQELTEAICDANPEMIHALKDEIDGIDYYEFTNNNYGLLTALAGTLNYVKRNEHSIVVRPGTEHRNVNELKLARALRASDFARFSLQTLGEVLAILYPVFVIIFADKDLDFDDFIAELGPIGLIQRYIDEARDEYGEFESKEELLEALQAHPDNFFDPDEEPVEESSNAKFEDFKDLLPDIAETLYAYFYNE